MEAHVLLGTPSCSVPVVGGGTGCVPAIAELGGNIASMTITGSETCHGKLNGIMQIHNKALNENSN